MYTNIVRFTNKEIQDNIVQVKQTHLKKANSQQRTPGPGQRKKVPQKGAHRSGGGRNIINELQQRIKTESDMQEQFNQNQYVKYLFDRYDTRSQNILKKQKPLVSAQPRSRSINRNSRVP